MIPIWNQPVLTRRCLESILKNTELPVRLILVDNASSEETRTALEQFRAPAGFQVNLLRNSKNLGFIKAVNQGIRAGNAPWVCILNNDTAVGPGWLSEMLKVALADPKIGLVNPTSNSLGFDAGKVPLESYAQMLRARSGQATELSTALGFCLFARRRLLESVGLLDESFGMGYFDDDDLSWRVRQAGYRCVRAAASYVFHEERASFRLLRKNRQAFRKNRRLFEQRWGRRLRILWVWDPSVGPRVALDLAAQGHWLTFIVPNGNLPAEVAEHAQVSRLEVRDGSWRLPATLRLLLKRKKPFDLVISPDPGWSIWVRRLRALHRAELLSTGNAEEILQQCRRLSRSPSWSALEETRPLPAGILCPLSVVVITKNEATRLAECLDSVRWAGEIVVVDDESTDETLRVAGRYTDRVFQRGMDIEGRHRNWAYAQARHEWVFSLDADERVTPELAGEIRDLLAGDPEFDVYSVPRRNYIGRRWICHGGWYPSPQVKLFKRSVFSWEETTVHPRAITRSTKPWGALKQELIHYSYRDLGDFLGKLNRQTTLEAQKWVQDQRRMGLAKALWRSLDRFVRTLWFKQGYRDGFIGYLVAVYAGLYQFLSFAKYWHLKEMSSSPSIGVGGSGPRFRGDDFVHRKAQGGNGSGNRSKLSVVILAYNAQATLPQCLSSVKWADEVIVVDGGSMDGTLEACRWAGAKVVTEKTRDDFARLRNVGAEAAAGDWVLQLDADEVVTPEFRQALEGILAKPVPHAAYKFRRKNNFLGHWMLFGGWDHYSLHLFRKGAARYEGRVHERLLVQGSTGILDSGVEHYPFRSLEEFVDRQNRYTSLQARDLLDEQGGVSLRTFWFQTTVKPARLFWKIYVKKQGFREGLTGFIFAGLFACVHLLKWAKLWELLESQQGAG